jgi:hypothetical protein
MCKEMFNLKIKKKSSPAAPILAGGTRYLISYPLGGRLLGDNNLTHVNMLYTMA